MTIEKQVFRTDEVEYYVYRFEETDDIKDVWAKAAADGLDDSSMPNKIHDLTHINKDKSREARRSVASAVAIALVDGYEIIPGYFHCVYTRIIESQLTQDSNNQSQT